MNFRFISALFSACILGSALFVTAQKKDTIYFNSKWQICDQSLAHYYRIATIQLDSLLLFYTGEVNDYYTNGAPQMKGFYSVDGVKDGDFSFYYPNGNIQSRGRFIR